MRTDYGFWEHSCVLLCSLWFLISCSASEGTVTLTAYGESFIEEGISSEVMADDWSVEFTQFTVAFDEVRVGGAEVEVDSPVELTADSGGDGHEIGWATLGDGQDTGFSFAITGVDVAGSATRGDTSKSFVWTFTETARYHECETATSVGRAEDSTLQITIHADHLFYDSLVAAEPELRFQALADADADADGEITRGELEATDIGGYDPGSEDGLDDLWSWLEAQARSLGHVDGEGHCETSSER